MPTLSLPEVIGKAKDVLKSFSSANCGTVHIILGNESCDLDSAASALSFAALLGNNEEAVLPVLNIPRDEFNLRTEVKFIFRKIGIPAESLIFRDEIDLAALHAEGRLRLTLVDHHVLPARERALTDSLVGVVDHRPRDTSQTYPAGCDVEVRTVGSCATLVGQRILDQAPHLLDRQLATLIRATILLDTACFNPQADRTTLLDVSVVEACEERGQITESRTQTFERMVSARRDVSSLTSFQVLHKDMKVVQGLLLPGMPILVRDFLQRPDAAAALSEFCTKHKSDTAIVIGMSFLGEASDDLRRDLAVYSKGPGSLSKVLVETLQSNKTLELTPRTIDVQGICLFDQGNLKVSRKQLVPIVQKVLSAYER